jgi:Beta-ketoacyl synthase, N-terminal domain
MSLPGTTHLTPNMHTPNMHTLYIDGIAMWTPAHPGWQHAAPALRREAAPALRREAAPALRCEAAPAAAPATTQRPSPSLLAANERRRAPDTVLLALEVAAAAVAASGHSAADMASVFTSAHGDLPTTDALCTTLASAPLLLSPTRFHHSVHNAASGYWAIASGSTAASTALSAHSHSFAVGLLEAASQCTATGQPVLLVGYDTQAVGALASVNRSQGLLAVALVLAPQPGPCTRWSLRWGVQAEQVAPNSQAQGALGPVALSLAGNAMADALPLFQALAHAQPADRVLALGAGVHLRLELQPQAPD